MMAKISKFLRENNINYSWKYIDKANKVKALTTDWVKNRDAHIDFPLITVWYDCKTGYISVHHHSQFSKNLVNVEFVCGTMDTFLRKLMRYNIVNQGQLKKLKSVKSLT